MPAFLLENLLFMMNIGIKNSIQIYMHEILKILIIATCHRIYGFIRECHGIQKSIQRTFCQFNKGILYGKFLGTAQYRMLHNVRNPGTVIRRSSKTDIKHFIVIIIR